MDTNLKEIKADREKLKMIRKKWKQNWKLTVKLKAAGQEEIKAGQEEIVAKMRANWEESRTNQDELKS